MPWFHLFFQPWNTLDNIITTICSQAAVVRIILTFMALNSLDINTNLIAKSKLSCSLMKMTTQQQEQSGYSISFLIWILFYLFSADYSMPGDQFQQPIYNWTCYALQSEKNTSSQTGNYLNHLPTKDKTSRLLLIWVKLVGQYRMLLHWAASGHAKKTFAQNSNSITGKILFVMQMQVN